MSWLSVILAGLVVYRLTNMVVTEDGPFGFFTWLRSITGEKFGYGHWLHEGFNCPLCVSFWLALTTPILLGFSSWQTFVLLWIGSAGGVAIAFNVLEVLTNGDS